MMPSKSNAENNEKRSSFIVDANAIKSNEILVRCSMRRSLWRDINQKWKDGNNGFSGEYHSFHRYHGLRASYVSYAY